MNRSARKLACVFAALLIVEQTSIFAWAAATHRIAQKGRAFEIQEIDIRRGDTLTFANDDPFLHQIFVESPTLSFESDEQPPGETVQVKFPAAGTFEVRCHIHPKMLLTVDVS
jgi:plastocyanin